MYCRYIYGIFIQCCMKIRKPTTPKNTDPTQSKIIAILAKNIKYYRNKQLISQEYLAELCELHRNYIGQVERGECNISIMNLEAIARALKVNLIDLLQK